MNAISYFGRRHNMWSFLIFVVMSFLGVVINHRWPSYGLETWGELIWLATFFGIILGMLGYIDRYSSEEMSSRQRIQIRLFGFVFYFAALFIGGGVGLVVFK